MQGILPKNFVSPSTVSVEHLVAAWQKMHGRDLSIPAPRREKRAPWGPPDSRSVASSRALAQGDNFLLIGSKQSSSIGHRAICPPEFQVRFLANCRVNSALTAKRHRQKVAQPSVQNCISAERDSRLRRDFHSFPQISPISTAISTEIAKNAISALASRFFLIDIANTQVCDVRVRRMPGPEGDWRHGVLQGR